AGRATYRAAAGVDDEVAGREQGLDLIEADRADHTPADQPRRRRRQGATARRTGSADAADRALRARPTSATRAGMPAATAAAWARPSAAAASAARTRRSPSPGRARSGRAAARAGRP